LPSAHVYLGHLSPTVEEPDIRMLVEPIIGYQVRRVIVRQKVPGSVKHCFVWTESEEDAYKIIKCLNGYRAKHSPYTITASFAWTNQKLKPPPERVQANEFARFPVPPLNAGNS